MYAPMKLFMKSPESGSLNNLYLCCSPDVETRNIRFVLAVLLRCLNQRLRTGGHICRATRSQPPQNSVTHLSRRSFGIGRTLSWWRSWDRRRTPPTYDPAFLPSFKTEIIVIFNSDIRALVLESSRGRHQSGNQGYFIYLDQNSLGSTPARL